MPDYPDSHSSPSSIPDSSLRELNGGDSPGIKRSGAPLSDPRPEKIRVICRPASRSSRGRASRRLAAKDEEIARARHEVNFLKESIKSVGSTHQEEKSRMTTEHQGKVHELKQRHILHLNQVLFEHKLRASSDLKAEDEAQETRMSSLQEDIEAQKRALSDVQKQFQRAIDNQITHEHLIDALCDLERQISKKRLTVVDRLNSNLHNDSNEEAALQLIQPKIDEIVQPYNYRIFDLETSLELSEQRVKDLHREVCHERACGERALKELEAAHALEVFQRAQETAAQHEQFRTTIECLNKSVAGYRNTTTDAARSTAVAPESRT